MLYEQLKLYRLNKSIEEGIRSYMIYKNTELDDLVRIKPKTKSELLSIKGFGNNKVHKYGGDIIRIIMLHKG